MTETAHPRIENPQLPTLAEATRLWLKIGCLSFGGPAGQIALLHREVVEERHWIGERRFLHALNFCTLLPGPEAQQLAVYLGWLMHGAKGGAVAGLLFVIPGALVMLALSIVYAVYGNVPFVEALFFGLKSAVLVLVLQALVRIGRRALRGRWAWMLAASAFVALFFFALPFPAVVLAAALIGYLAPGHFSGAGHGKEKDGLPALLDAVLDADPAHVQRLSRSARRGGILATILWFLPATLLLPIGGRFADIGWFFSKLAVVTFGGAYAALAYVAQQADKHYHWVSAQEMLSGLGLAETTPGPLVLVLQFVGFMAGYRAPGGLTGLPGGIVASALTLWAIFAPCFAFVLLGAPLIERLQTNRQVSGALAAITAGVVGVIGNLAVWFALHTLFRIARPVEAGILKFDMPLPQTLDPWALLLAALAAVCLLRLKLSVPLTLAICAVASVGVRIGGYYLFLYRT